MAELFISYINLIRFRPIGSDVMPRIDKMENGVKYYKGIYPLPNYKADWLLGQEIVIQIQTDLTEAAAALVYLRITTPSGSTTDVNPTDITPTGWQVNGVAGRVLNFSYTPPNEGVYSIRTLKSGPGITQHFISDDFYARGNNNDLVEIQYSDTKNNFDGVFYDADGNSLWSPKAYFTGIAIAGKPKNESSIYEDDNKVPIRTRGETLRTIDVSLTDLTRNSYSQLIDILTCDTNYINNQKVISTEEIDSKEIEKSDTINVVLNMIRVEYNNFVKNV